MKKSILFVFVAALLLTVTPAWAQCTKDQGKAGCSKDQQKQCAQTCSKDGKSCTATCPTCGKTFAATCSKDGKSCTGTCPGCNKEMTIPCPNADQAKGACCAGDKTPGDKAACAGQTAAPAGCSKEGQPSCAAATCSGDVIRYKNAAIPAMLYDVAGQRVGCPKSAVAMAAEKNCAVKYVVDGKVYEDKAAALEAQAEVLDKCLNDSLSVKYCIGEEVTCCPKTAETLAQKKGQPVCYRLTGYMFKDQDSAEKAAKQAKVAAEAINMKIIVGDQEFDCPTTAAEAAKKDGKEVDYCVGEMRTTSETVAKIQLEIERIKAAIDKIEECGGTPA